MLSNRKGLCRQWVCILIVSVSYMSNGCLLGWTSPVMPLLVDPHSRYDVDLTETQMLWVVISLHIGGIVAAPWAGLLSDHLGRKLTLQLGGVAGVLAWLLPALLHNVEALYVGRLLGGAWCAIITCVAPVYNSEITDPQVRGAASSVCMVSFNIGILAANCIAPYVSYDALLCICCSPAAVFSLCCSLVPESPYYHLKYEHPAEARVSLGWLRGTEDVAEELQRITEAVYQQNRNRGRLVDLVNTYGNRRATLIVQTLSVVATLHGSTPLITYLSLMIPDHSFISADNCATVIFSTWVLFSLVPAVLVDRVGRKSLLLISLSGCSLCMTVASIWFYVDTATDYSPNTVLLIASYVMFGAFRTVGISVVPIILLGELFPTNVRSLASLVSVITSFMAAIVANNIFQITYYNFGMSVTFISIAVVNVLAAWFVVIFVYETKGQTLEEIQQNSHKAQTKSVETIN